ncbi:MAG: serine/threonine-protein kinase [Gemmataceae bacterium]
MLGILTVPEGSREPQPDARPGAELLVPANLAGGDVPGVPFAWSWRSLPSAEPPPQSDTPSPTERPSPPVQFPVVGTTFLNFRLIAELGRGTFGRVYLARQGDLAQRLVALKVSSEIHPESQRLAQLQHTHIVPIYSLHQTGPLYAVCMPFFGATTLADILQDLLGQAALPASGKGLITTLEGRSSRTRGLTPAVPPGEPTPVPAPRERSPTLQHLEGCTYVEAVLWLGTCLAEGLAHAHDRGILHRDLKPANVLLTDDGTPMLLDFNLAEDLKEGRPPATQVGGTLPYMAPEHLAAFLGLPDPCGGGRPVVDARSDLYSLGVMLFELLTGHYPFTRFQGEAGFVVPAMIRERLTSVPDPCRFNPVISPAVRAILGRCLAPDPARRYASVHELREDLQCQLDHRPLRHVPEPSLIERLKKWSARHPRVVSLTSVSLGAAVLLVTMTVALGLRSRSLMRLEARASLHGFEEDLRSARLLLTGRDEQSEDREVGRALARCALDRFAVLDRPDWTTHSAARHLSSAEQQTLRTQAGELLLLLAADAPTEEALALNGRAAECYLEDETPRLLWRQRADLLDRLGRATEAQALLSRSEHTPLRGSTDQFLQAVHLVMRGHHADATTALQQLVSVDPEHFAAWSLLGACCLEGTGPAREAEAVGHYTACLALRPRYSGAWYNRGIAYLRLGRFDRAIDDFTRALELHPQFTPARVTRALAHEAAGRPRAALEDLDLALAGDRVMTRARLIRARLRRVLGDLPGAEQDRLEALTRSPDDEEGWIARGVARIASDAPSALTDFNQALRLNPRSLAGWQNRAHVLSERLGRTREAISALDRLLALRPGHPAAHASRGVLRARLNQVELALADAREALRNGSTPEIAYQVAGIHALCSRSQRDQADRAFSLLSQALEAGFGHRLLPTDPDLEPLRADARFRGLLRAIALLRDSANSNPQGVSP